MDRERLEEIMEWMVEETSDDPEMKKILPLLEAPRFSVWDTTKEEREQIRDEIADSICFICCHLTLIKTLCPRTPLHQQGRRGEEALAYGIRLSDVCGIHDRLSNLWSNQ